MPPPRAQVRTRDIERIRLRSDHLPEAARLSSAVGWPYREEDWRFAFALGTGIAVEHGGRLVATALWWPYAERYASCGMIIVEPAMQGQGLGRSLMAELLRQAGDRTIFLNSTHEGLRLYASLGFVQDGRIFQHQGIVPKDFAPGTSGELRLGGSADAAAILQADAQATGMDRAALIESLLAVSAVEVVDRGADLEGYAFCRRFGRGMVIGPVVAPNEALARALIVQLACRHRGMLVRTDVSEASGLSAWLETIGLTKVDEAIAMVRGTRASPGANVRLFALSNQSLG